MARIAGVNIPTQKRVVIALQYIHGIGPHFAKSRVLTVAHAYQRETDWHRRVPRDWA